MFRYIIPIILVLTLVTLACGVDINLPVKMVTPGPEVTDDINVTLPSTSNDVNLKLAFGAGSLYLAPGGGNSLVTGTATYNLPDLKPKITTAGSSVSIKQGEYKITGISNIPNLEGLKNEWDLKLGDIPLALTIQAGAYDAHYDLGGLSLKSLTVQDGASDVVLSFSSPNKTTMSLLRYETGASSVDIKGLGNANFSTFIFKSGAGNYTLDFSGDLKRDGTVTIDSGISNITLLIPAGIPVQVTVEGGLSNVNAGAGWTTQGNVYTQSGSGSSLTFVIKIGAGNLTIGQ